MKEKSNCMTAKKINNLHFFILIVINIVINSYSNLIVINLNKNLIVINCEITILIMIN